MLFMLTHAISSTADDSSDSDFDAISSNESSYVPNSNTSDESDAKEEKCATADNTGERLMNSANASTDLDVSHPINKVGHSAPDDNEMFVKTVESGIKKDFCIYCQKEQGKLSRHVTRLHKNEEDVAQFLSFEKGSDERKKIMAKLRKQGQFFFNTNRAVNTGNAR